MLTGPLLDIADAQAAAQEAETTRLHRELAEANPDALFLDGFDGAFLGYAQQHSKPPLAVYDREKCVQILRCQGGLTHEDAEEYFAFNIEGAWTGPNTPLILTGPETT